MVTKAIYASLKAKPGKEAEVEAFLKSAVPLVNAEPSTITWYALKEGPGMYSIFDTFEDDGGRDAHLNGKVAAALMSKADELFAEPPKINKIDVLADK
jgi:quinol monooxygenase YgiN